jgi:hypothetical protein
MMMMTGGIRRKIIENNAHSCSDKYNSESIYNAIIITANEAERYARTLAIATLGYHDLTRYDWIGNRLHF